MTQPRVRDPLRSIIATAAGFDVISCDIFDTAVSRVLARPADLFLAVGLRATRLGLTSDTPETFAKRRTAAEASVRARVEAQGDDELRICEIYGALAAGGVVNDAAAGAAVEFAAELAACRPIAEVQKALRELSAAAAPPRIIFTSDTYWPAEQLVLLLRNCGYDFKFDVISSADLRRSKHTGRLFAGLLAFLDVAPSRVLHIGDNPHSDVVQPRRHGLAALHLPRRRPAAIPDHGDAITGLASSITAARAASDRRKLQTVPDADGSALASVAAPLLLGFALFVLETAHRLGISRIYFLSRDGYLPLALCRRLVAATGQAEAFQLHYLYVSRAALADVDGLRTYLNQNGFLDPGRRLVVDLGWHGTVQHGLGCILSQSPTAVHGAYLGLWREAMRPGFGLEQASGYLFSFGAPDSRAAALRHSYLVAELIFSAPHGSVLGYAAGAGGLSAPVFDTEPGAPGDTRRAAFAALEAECLEIFDTLDALVHHAWPERVPPDAALAPMKELLLRPRPEDVARVMRIPFVHGAGALRPAFSPVPWHELLLHPIRSWRRLQASPWRMGAVTAALPGIARLLPQDSPHFGGPRCCADSQRFPTRSGSVVG